MELASLLSLTVWGVLCDVFWGAQFTVTGTERSEYTLEVGVPFDPVDEPLSVPERDERL
jgi:hypothetical protein